MSNSDQRSSDYEAMRHVYRPSHADYTYTAKYGVRDHRGGGRSSARETVSRVVAGAFARQALAASGISLYAYTSQVGPLALDADYRRYDPALIDSNPVRCPDPAMAERMRQLILEVKGEGDTVGGVVTGVITGVPAGLGEPVSDKLHARLASAMMGINAVKGFEYGMGFAGAPCAAARSSTDLCPTAVAVSPLRPTSPGAYRAVSPTAPTYISGSRSSLWPRCCAKSPLSTTQAMPSP